MFSPGLVPFWSCFGRKSLVFWSRSGCISIHPTTDQDLDQENNNYV